MHGFPTVAARPLLLSRAREQAVSVSDARLFMAETDQGRQWLAARAATGKYQRLGKSLAVDDEDDARVWLTPPWPTGWT